MSKWSIFLAARERSSLVFLFCDAAGVKHAIKLPPIQPLARKGIVQDGALPPVSLAYRDGADGIELAGIQTEYGDFVHGPFLLEKDATPAFLTYLKERVPVPLWERYLGTYSVVNGRVADFKAEIEVLRNGACDMQCESRAMSRALLGG